MAGVLVVLVFVDTFLTGFLLSEYVRQRKVLGQVVREQRELAGELGLIGVDDAR